MNKKMRVLAALENRETDHVPAAFWFHFPADKAEGQACVDAHLQWYRDTDQDFIKIMCDGYFGYPNETLEKLADVSELYKMKPLGENHPLSENRLNVLQQLLRRLTGNAVFFITFSVPCPFSGSRQAGKR